MVWYFAVVAVVNIGLGYALATYFRAVRNRNSSVYFAVQSTSDQCSTTTNIIPTSIMKRIWKRRAHVVCKVGQTFSSLTGLFMVRIFRPACRTTPMRKRR